jgi:hypothetical protein
MAVVEFAEGWGEDDMAFIRVQGSESKVSYASVNGLADHVAFGVFISACWCFQ